MNIRTLLILPVDLGKFSRPILAALSRLGRFDYDLTQRGKSLVSSLARRVVPVLSPSALGMARAIICAVALLNSCWENLPSLSLLPTQMHARDMGAFDFLPTKAALLSSSNALAALQIATVLFLILAMCGLWTRWTVALAAAALFVFQGVLRSGTGVFWHSGIVPLQLLCALAFTPCGDGFSFDAWRRGSYAASRAYGLSLWTLWAIIAAFYALAGASKLRESGLDWFAADNLRGIILKDSLAPMQFSWTWGLSVVHFPDWLLSVAAVFTVIVELAFPLVLFSRGARALLPLAAAALHLGVWATQRVFFWDLLLLPVLFYVPWLVSTRLWSPSQEIAERRALHRFAIPAVVCVAAILANVWCEKTSFFPVDDVAMYSNTDVSGIVRWDDATAIYSDGTRAAAPIEAALPSLRDSRYRWALSAMFDGPWRGHIAARGVLSRTAEIYNRNRAADAARIVGFEVVRHEWNYKSGQPRIISRIRVGCHS